MANATKFNGATHFIYAFDTVLDTDTLDNRADTYQGGELLFNALQLDGGTLPAGTKIEFRCQSIERDTGERVFGVALG